ncbi:MAG: hypothetical protein JXM70_02470 [Pirellulales bacterium]|nr:hypothetical protein [Pirellulales bacterium]
MNTLLLCICLSVVAGEKTVEVRAPQVTDKLVTPLHFAVNCEFYRPGVFAGTLPEDDPRSKAGAFAAALRASGIRTLRLPGGDGVYYYLPEGRSQTMKLAHAVNFYEFRDENPGAKYFVTLANMAAFARKYDVKLIYQLPMLFHLDMGVPRAAIRSAFSKHAKNYDHDRIDAQADYAVGIVRRLRELQAPVAAWELGNEEYGHCGGGDYGKVAAAIVERLRRQDTTTPIVAVGMGKEWLTECVKELRRQDVLKKIDSFNAHYPFGTWPGPKNPAERTNPSALVRGDVLFGRWFDAATKQRTELGITTSSMAVTETMVFKFGAPYWEAYNLIGTHAHALLYVWNWMTLLADPRCNIAVFHDLETPFFGMLRYNVGYDESTRRFVWLDGAKQEQKLARFPGQYVLSPTCVANRMLSSLVGHRVGLATLIPEDSNLRILWGVDTSGRVTLVAVHRSADSKTVSFPGMAVENAECLTAEDLGSVLPGSYKTTPLLPLEGRSDRLTLPPWSVTLVKIGI